MRRTIRADGDTWRVRLGERSPSPDTRVVLFFPATNSQRPYRVAEVPAERVPDAAGLANLPDETLHELFALSRSLAFPRSYP